MFVTPMDVFRDGVTQSWALQALITNQTVKATSYTFALFGRYPLSAAAVVVASARLSV